jgi:hypothetical protein
MIRTIEEILGLPPQNLHDAGVRPMTRIFDATNKNWTYRAAPSKLLLGTQLPFELVQPGVWRADAVNPPRPFHDAAWPVDKTRAFDFTDADHSDPALYNRILWEGTMRGKPYRAARSELDPRHDRDALLAGPERQSAGTLVPGQ